MCSETLILRLLISLCKWEARITLGRAPVTHGRWWSPVARCVNGFFRRRARPQFQGDFFKISEKLDLVYIWSSSIFPLNFLNKSSHKSPHQTPTLGLRRFERALALTLQQRSSSSSTSFLSVGTTSLPSGQYVPCLLSDTTQVLLCPGSCCLRLAIEVTWAGVLYGGIFCSHSEIQEATEMLLQELERLCSCGWLRSCWPAGSWAR